MMRYFLLTIVLVGCNSITAPEGAYRVDPPAFFTEHWTRMEACSGIHGDLQRITWYAVPAHFATKYDPKTAGLWVKPHTIYVVESAMAESAWGQPGTLVPHEMLHDLLQTGDHPAAFDQCGVR